jgi:ketosteroid isomerase-like protein
LGGASVACLEHISKGIDIKAFDIKDSAIYASATRFTTETREDSMNDQQTAIDAIEELERAWSQAEMRADTGTLEAIAIADFILVGPLGFVLDKRQWLDRYRSGDLVTDSVSLEDPAIRVHGDAAVTIARHVQRASYKGQPVDGQFRTTHIAVRGDGRWLLAGIHLSPIGGPPPFARPAEQGTREGAPPTEANTQ